MTWPDLVSLDGSSREEYGLILNDKSLFAPVSYTSSHSRGSGSKQTGGTRRMPMQGRYYITRIYGIRRKHVLYNLHDVCISNA